VERSNGVRVNNTSTLEPDNVHGETLDAIHETSMAVCS
jgi:hypothetical protein